MKKEISIVMPAFNEEANIEKTVRDCFLALERLGVSGEVVVTDDGSIDKTRSIIEGLKNEYPDLSVVIHEKNSGYGESLKDAIFAARGKYIVSIDSDGQFDISEIPVLIKEQNKGYDVVAGYRKKKKDAAFKVIADRGLNIIMRMLFGVSYRDTNCAFKLYSPGILDKIHIEARGYQAPTEILMKLHTIGARIAEVGVTHFAREKGKSALSPFRTIYQMLVFLIYLRLKVYLYKMRIIKEL